MGLLSKRASCPSLIFFSLGHMILDYSAIKTLPADNFFSSWSILSMLKCFVHLYATVLVPKLPVGKKF